MRIDILFKYPGFFLILMFISAEAVAQQAPYPPSTHVESIEWNYESHLQYGQGSDQWPLTWAEDDHLYSAWGDGWGWLREEDDAKRSIGVTRITGRPPQLSGTDTWGAGPGSSFGKPDALIAFDRKIFMFWTNGDSRFDHDSYSAISSDSGKTWKLGKDRIFDYAPAGFRVRGICQFGKGYKDAPDEYLYIYFGYNRHPDIYLARVEKQYIFNADAYEWFEYRNPDGSASWAQDFSRKSVVFHDNNAYKWHLDVSYISDMNRYLLAKPHFSEEEYEGRDSVTAPLSGLGVFDAPTPWGPWTTVYYQDHFLDDYQKFNYVIPAKFWGGDGTSFWMVWSGWPEYDNVNFIEGRLILNLNP